MQSKIYNIKVPEINLNFEFRYSKFGLKPHFLDIFQQQFIGLLFRLKENDSYNKEDMISGFTVFLSYLIDCMNTSYAQAINTRRLEMHAQQKKDDQKGELKD